MNLQDFIDIDRQWLLAWNGSNLVWLDNLALVLTNALTWIPLYLMLLYLIIKNNEKAAQIFLVISLAALCLLLSGGLSDLLVKPLVKRPRPFADVAIASYVDLVRNYRPTGYSFYSAHAANITSLALFVTLLVRSRKLGFCMAIWALITCWTRIYLGVHFPFDVVVGMLWGLIAGTAVYILYLWLYNKISPKLHYISTQYTRTGYSLTDIDTVICIYVLTYIYAAVRAVIIGIN